MIFVDKSLGNTEDPAWATRLGGATVDFLRLDQWQAQKHRFRLRTEAGAEVGAALDRNARLRDGDILAWDEASRTAIVARVSLNEVMALGIDEVLGRPAEVLARAFIELGHALGNQHWPALVKGAKVYIPLTVDRRVMASVMKTHAFEGVTCEFLPGSEVIPFLAPHEARRLFGGADATPHSHAGDL